MLASGRAKSQADLCSFARRAMAGKAKVRQDDGKAVGRAKAEQDDEAMDYLLKPSPLFVAGLTLGVAIAKATAVAKIRIKQFLAIPLAGKVVAGPCMLTLPLFLLYRDVGPRSRTGERQESPAGAIDTGMKTFHEWLAERMKNEGLWLNDKNAVVGMSNMNPLLQKKAKVKPLKLPKAKLGVGATPKPFKAIAPAAFKPKF